MPRAVRSTRSGTFAVAALPPFGDGVATVRQAVHDGDTVNVAPEGDFAIRFLGVDTAERSFDFPLRADEAPRANPRFVSLSDADWETFLADPFSSDWRSFTAPLDSALQADLANRAGAGAAANHDFWPARENGSWRTRSNATARTAASSTPISVSFSPFPSR
jgi:hypothetical protein